VNPGDPQEDHLEDSAISTLLRRFFPFYCALAALVTFGYALYDGYQIDGDAVAYMDLGDLLRAHHWAGIVNGYWHPMYPAFLALGHTLSRATPATELRAYYFVNFGIFLLGMVAIVCFADSIMRLRESASQQVSKSASQRVSYLLDRTMLRFLGLSLLVIASQRELSLGKIRPDALLQAFLLFAMAVLLAHLATNRLRYAALMGVALGCAYLTKSFAFVFAFVCVILLVVFRWIWLKHRPARILSAALVALLCFAVVAGPYVAALSHQRHRFDFGDSGALNYAWYVCGTQKMHLQPYQTAQFGSSEVHLKHPEKELLHTPLVLSYAEMPYGTYPDWFDTTYWNEQIKPHFSLRQDLPRATRDCVLVARYLFNHPEALLLLALLLLLGARPVLRWKPGRPGTNAFWLPPLLLGVSIWGIYAIVNTEERYVTVAYLSILLPLFAALRLPQPRSEAQSQPARNEAARLRFTASALLLLLALLAAGESLRIIFEDRRQIVMVGHPGGWYSPTMIHIADGLQSLGVHPGDSVACVGPVACLNDPYWARLDGVRILTEIYDPETPVPQFLAALPNREQAIDVVRAQGVKVLVADFGNFRVSDSDPAFRSWQQLGGTTFYALPLN
jgi:4-amino-4-deoxy-L-arabinose transferase-like glycosyltransferase